LNEIPPDARRRLLGLLPWARGEAKKSEDRVVVHSAAATSQLQYLTEDNLGGIWVYPAPLGGWHCDLLLKNVPPGVPNAMGTQVGAPLKTRAEAEELAKTLLIAVLVMMEMPKKKQDPVFLLYGWNMPLPRIAIARAPDFYPEFGAGFESIDHAEAAIIDRLMELCPDGDEAGLADLNDWSAEKKSRLLSVLVRAAMTGLFVYPRRRDGVPVDHDVRRDAPPPN
jgi:hypothetical protein